MFDETALISQQDKLKRFAYHLTNNMAEAEDLLQSTMLRALEKRHYYREDSNLGGWLSKIMYNMFITNYKRNKKFASSSDPEKIIEQQSVDANQETELKLKEVMKAITRLSTEHKNIVEMTCIQGLSYNEVSEMYDIPVGTVRSRLSRAREHIHKIMNNNVSNNNQRTIDRQAA